jgi:hypothetical protein
LVIVKHDGKEKWRGETNQMEPDIGDKGIFSLSRFLKKLKL